MMKKLSDIANISPGYPFRTSIEPDDNSDVYVVQLRDAQPNGQINQNQIIKTTLPGKKNPIWLESGDILFSARGSKNFASLVEDLPKKTVCSPHFFIVKVKKSAMDKVSAEFICWQLNQLYAQRYFIKTAEGGINLGIRRKVLESVPIKLIPINNQREIVALHRSSLSEQKILQQLIDNRQQELKAIALDLLRK